MKYRIHGASKANAAKTVIEVEAASKAAAEKIAASQNIIVSRVEDISSGEAKHAIVHGGSNRSAGISPLVKLVFLLVVAGVIYFFWGQIRRMIGR